MGFLSKIAGLYAALFVVSLFLSNYWLGLAVGLLGVGLVVFLCLMLDDIDRTKAEIEWVEGKIAGSEWVKEKIDRLEDEIKKLKEKEIH